MNSALESWTSFSIAQLILIVIFLQPWQDTEDSSWLREYPETLVQFLLFLYRNITSFSVVCTSQEFLEKLVAVLFPKRRNLAKFQEVLRWVCCGNFLPSVVYRRIFITIFTSLTWAIQFLMELQKHYFWILNRPSMISCPKEFLGPVYWIPFVRRGLKNSKF